jgi:aminocarboxymuconate-semialdehyde decarboxylase
MTPSRPAIDIHTHVMPPGWEDMAARFGVQGWPWVKQHDACRATIMLGEREFRHVTDQCFVPARRLRDMEAEQVGRQLISPIPVLFCYWGPADATAEFARMQNDYIAETVARNPRHFLGAGTVAMQSLPHAQKELERLKTLGFPAVEIGTNVNGRDLDDPAIAEILATAESLDLAVFVHPWDALGKERTREFYLPHLLTLPAETSLAMARLILGGVLDRLPRLRIGFAHGGGTFPALLGRIDRGYTVRPEAKVKIARPPSSYVRRLWVDSITHDPRMLRVLCEVFGSDRVMLGSDYPFDMGDPHPVAQLAALPSQADADNVAFRAAEEFLGRS